MLTVNTAIKFLSDAHSMDYFFDYVLQSEHTQCNIKMVNDALIYQNSIYKQQMKPII